MVDASNMPYWQTAETYFDAGWSPIPLPFKEKSPVPDNVTGSTAPYVTAEQVARWVGRKTPGGRFRGRPEQARAGNLSFMPGNIALRLPTNVLGIDVDLYGGKAGAETLTDAEKRWGKLPPTWVTTSRTDESGIRLFRVPEGLKWRDVGPGIDEALLPRVFDRFFRANTQTEGSGLGLSIVQAIVNRYDGMASLRNRDDGQTGIVASVGFIAVP